MKKLVILTKKWGRNFSGATLATQYFVKHWVYYFERIIVYTLKCGDSIVGDSIIVNECGNEIVLRKRLASDFRLSKEADEYIGYSDDHLGYILSRVGIPYFHTYHGNWPEAKYSSLEMFLKSYYFIPLYKKTIGQSECVINVSQHMEVFTQKYNRNSIVIRNGIDYKPNTCEEDVIGRFVMVGNIDKRKYGLALALLQEINRSRDKVNIDIYGRILDVTLAERLREFKNVRLCGEVSNIPYRQYKGLINTSRIENLSISVCEAISCGIPVFCFDVGGLSEVVKNEKTGFLIKSFDIEKMAEIIIDYEVANKPMTVDTGVLKEFKWEIASRRYCELFFKNA